MLAQGGKYLLYGYGRYKYTRTSGMEHKYLLSEFLALFAMPVLICKNSETPGK